MLSIERDTKIYLGTRRLSTIRDVPEFNAIRFGAWLRGKREDIRFSVTELAEMAGMSKQYLSRLERAEEQLLTNKPTQPALDKVENLAKALGVNVNDAREMAGYERTDESNGLYKGMDKLSPDQQRLAKRQIKAIIDSLAEQDHDFDYIDDEEEPSGGGTKGRGIPQRS